jgi:hypothetical protein
MCGLKFKYGCIALILGFFSCVKTGSPDPVIPPPPDPPLTDGLVKSLTTYLAGARSKTVQQFSYDQNQLLTGMRSYTYDSLFDPYVDSMSVTLGSWQSGKPPVFYDVLYRYHWAPASGLSEHHLLFYDNQNRIIRDSIADGTNGNNSNTVVYTYDDVAGSVMGKNTVYLNGSPPTVQVNGTDSFLIESENITYHVRYESQVYDQESDVIYSTTPNPLYNEIFAKSVGIILTFQSFGNFRNKDMPGHALFIDPSFNALTFNYRWAMDAKGRVVSGIGEAGSQLYEYAYTY